MEEWRNMDPDYLELTRADSGKLKPTMVMVTRNNSGIKDEICTCYSAGL